MIFITLATVFLLFGLIVAAAEKKFTIAASSLLIYVIVYGAHIESLSLPKKAITEFDKEDVVLISHVLHEEKDKIYIWVMKERMPRYYVIPYNEETAKKLTEAKRKENNKEVAKTILSGLFDTSPDALFVKHPNPQMKLPDKK